MRRIASLAILALVLASCRASTPVPGATDLPSTDLTPSPTETAAPRPARARLAVYSTGTEIVLYDVARDIARSVARGDGLSQPKFLSRDEIVFVGTSGSAGTLFRMRLTGGTPEELFTAQTGIDVYAVHPSGTEVAYITRGNDDFPRLRIVTLVEGRPVQSVATLARARGREVTPDDQLTMAWAPKGKRFFFVYSFADGDGGDVPDAQSQFQVRLRDGTLEYAADHGDDPTMGVWSADGRRIYFRTDGGTRAWLPSGEVRSVGGPSRWYEPWPSPDGRRIAYDTGQGDPGARVRVLDLRTGTTSAIGERGRFHPVFASAGVVWAQKLAACTQEDCLYPAYPLNEVVRINVRTGKERPLAITKLVGVDVWYEVPV